MARLRSKTGTYDQGIIASSSAPSAAFVGQIWFNNATGVTYQWTTDGASSFWLDISSSGIGTSATRGVDFVGDIDPHKATNLGVVGSVYYNREKNRHFVCTTATSGSQVWSGRYAGAGGTVYDYLSGSTYYRVHTFLTSGTFSVEDAMNVDFVVVAGGGSGGTSYAAGGGAGGFRTGTGLAVTSAQNYSITIGTGGAGVPANTDGNNGSNSVFSPITATGGGGGGGQGRAGAAGASGGGGGGAGTAGGGGIDNTGHTLGLVTHQGRDGGTGYVSGVRAGAGGGGAGAVGVNGTKSGSTAIPGAGGAGTNIVMGLSNTNSTVLLALIGAGVVSGSYRYLAGGGGGGSNEAAGNVTVAVGGIGGGGTAADGTTNSTVTGGTPNTGGGGGAAHDGANSGAGGSGIVIIRYAIT